MNEQTKREARRRTAVFLRVRAGEPDLFPGLDEELRELLRKRLRNDSRTRALGDNPEDVADVLQDTMLRLWAARDRFDPSRGEIDAWAWVIARNAAVSVLRLRWRGTPGGARLDAVADRRAAEPGAELAAAECRQAVAEAVGRVKDPAVRRAVRLRLIEGLPYAAVSAATGVPLGTVASSVHLVRKSLRPGARRAA
jgi:RNA polymerase sigma-70 factor (ECF subfamily)